MLAEAISPIMILGGSRWVKARQATVLFAERQQLPVAVSFQATTVRSYSSSLCGGSGIGVNPALIARDRQI